MKKSKRIVCTFLAAVMLLGVVPAHAAASLSPLAALLAIPVSGQILNSGPVSGSISKALAVEEIESTYSTETKSAPTSAPAAQTASSTAPGRLADGTTGATVGVPGTATYSYKPNNDPFYGVKVSISTNTKKYLVDPSSLTSVRAKANPTVYVRFDPQNVGPSKLAGLTVAAGCVADVYSGNTFLCQYDTRDGKDLVIPCAPGKDPSQTQTSTPTKGRTTFNDVKPGNWYYEAVTACAEGNILSGILDTDPNGNFNPNAMIDGTESGFVWKRVKGQATEELSFVLCGKNQIRHGAIQVILEAISKTEQETRLTQEMAAAGHDLYSPENQSADAKAIREFAQLKEAVNPNAPGTFYTMYENIFAHAYNLGLIRTPGSPEVIDLNAEITRAEYCYLLWKAGLTSFGCNASK